MKQINQDPEYPLNYYNLACGCAEEGNKNQALANLSFERKGAGSPERPARPEGPGLQLSSRFATLLLAAEAGGRQGHLEGWSLHT